MPYRYELTPYVWDTTQANRPYWRLPFSSVGGVDLRPLPAQGTAGGAPQGFAFATCRQSPGGTALATSFHMSETPVTAGIQSAWQSAMDYTPQGATLTDLLWDQLTTGSDPTGQNGPKPLMPGTDGQLRLYVGGHSLVKSELFTFGVHPHTNRVRDLLRLQFEQQWEATNGHDHCRRCLDYTCKKYRVDDWKEFVPARLHAHVPGRLPHATTITESFNKADSDTLGPDLTWTEVSGDWDVVSNAAELITTGSEKTARAESDLSSDDHYGQVVYLNEASSNEATGGACARFASAAETCYLHRAYRDNVFLQKIVGGTYTTLANAVETQAANDVLKVECDGSAIKGYLNAVEKLSVTDSSITGNTRCGIVGYSDGVAEPRLDSFEAADLAAGGGPPEFPAYLRGGGIVEIAFPAWQQSFRFR